MLTPESTHQPVNKSQNGRYYLTKDTIQTQTGSAKRMELRFTIEYD